MALDLSASDLLTIALLVGLEGLLSADNALVMAIMVLGLPKRDHQKVLRYGLLGGFIFRVAATVLAVHLIRLIEEGDPLTERAEAMLDPHSR